MEVLRRQNTVRLKELNKELAATKVGLKGQCHRILTSGFFLQIILYNYTYIHRSPWNNSVSVSLPFPHWIHETIWRKPFVMTFATLSLKKEGNDKELFASK